MLNATNLEASAAFAFMSIGFDATTSPLGPLPANLQPFGLSAACDLWVSADVSTLFAVAGGAGTYDFPVPNDPAFAAFLLYFQCGSIDAGAPGGIAVSNAVKSAIGY